MKIHLLNAHFAITYIFPAIFVHFFTLYFNTLFAFVSQAYVGALAHTHTHSHFLYLNGKVP